MRRRFLSHVLAVWLALPAVAARGENVQQWDVFELTLSGPSQGNPFVECDLWARFTQGENSIEVRGFYDGQGVYRVRFMPPQQGQWTYRTGSNRTELSGKSGQFTCVAAGPGNHGPVRVRNTHHFAYADGTAYKPVGTTAYGWVHQPDELQDQTLATLKASGFNKIRMCVLPTRYGEQRERPRRFPFVQRDGGRFDLERFDVEFFANLERRIRQLRDLGIEADLILFHPYDEGQMGLDRMPAEADDRYLRYVVARLRAYRNVWWSLANEFDLMTEKTDEDFDRFFQILQAEDPYAHLRSIHFSQRMYDPCRPWVTHLSVQNGLAVSDFGRAVLYRQVCAKPIVYDEVRYEGNIDRRWGQLSGQEMLLRMWMGTIAGTYVGHGECLREGDKPVWLSKGGVLRGTSPPRIRFLKQVLDDAPEEGIEPIDQFYETRIGGKAGQYYLIYFGRETPQQWLFELPKDGLADGMKFRVEVLDTWEMTVRPMDSTFVVRRHSPYVFRAEKDAAIPLPGKPYQAIRIRRVPD